jgi:very-short-patch-repair endonuclease
MATKRAKKMIAKLKKQAKNPEGIQGILKTNANKMATKLTWPEREFKKLLKELKVNFEVQKIVGNKIYDFYIPHLNMLIEVDGDYWHGNEEKFPVLNGLQKKAIRNDMFKDGLAAGLGFGLERVWESELKVDYKNVKARFKKILIG